MRTGTGFHVDNPSELLVGFVHHWYPLYDGVSVAEDNELRVIELALSTMLNSRISGNTGGEIWRQARKQLAEALAGIRVGVDLLDVPKSACVSCTAAVGFGGRSGSSAPNAALL
jgi:hypothetical protein